MKSVFVIVLLTIAGTAMGQEVDETQVSANEAGSYRADLRVSIMNDEFSKMNAGDTQQINLADDSYISLNKLDENTLHASVHIYSPGDEAHQTAYEGTYVWNDLANSLVAEKCKEHPVDVTPSTTPVECEEGIFTASRIISLELEGSINLEGYQSENLEKCIASKLPPKTVEIPYNKCMVKILGDPKYVGDGVENKIKELEAQGYVCEADGNCVKSEDPQVFADLLEELKGKPVQIDIPGDDRPRFCDLVSHPTMSQSVEGSEYLTSYQYSCNYWVNNVYCMADNNRLYWSVEYIDDKGHTELFQPHPFPVSSAQKVHVDWKNNERIHNLTLFTENTTLAVKELQFKFSSGRVAGCNLGDTAPATDSLHKLDIGLAGEIAGFEYLKVASGIRVRNVIERN